MGIVWRWGKSVGGNGRCRLNRAKSGFLTGLQQTFLRLEHRLNVLQQQLAECLITLCDVLIATGVVLLQLLPLQLYLGGIAKALGRWGRKGGRWARGRWARGARGMRTRLSGFLTGCGCVVLMGVACLLRPPLMLLWRGGVAVARAFGRWGGDAAARSKQLVVASAMSIRFIPAKLDASSTARESKKERKALPRAAPAPATPTLRAFGAAAQ
ncbi:hypothetical protein T484DRAFT_3644279, partial [Baffinella frigidus]